MKKLNTTGLLVFLSIVFAASFALGGGKWKKVKSKNGITVFTREVEGSDLDEFKGVSTIDADIEVVGRVIADVPSLKDWLHNCAVSKLISRSGNKTILYQETNAPWPVSNRDVVIESVTTKSPDKVVRRLRNVKHSAVPVKKGKVRIPKLRGSWTLTRKGDKTHVVYQLLTDPGGSLPTAMANKATKDLPFHTIEGLKKMVKLDKYQK